MNTSVASLCGPTCGVQLYVHVLGAVLLFGAVLAVALLAAAALTRPPEQALVLRRIGFWATLALVLPGWVVMYVGGFSTLDHEGLDKNTPGWADTGIWVAHVGAALVLLLLLLGWLSRRRPRLTALVATVAGVYLVALAVAWFAMSAKP